MIPIVGSMLQGQGTVTGMRDQLIIRTTLRNLAEIKKVLAQLDRPLRNFRIIVRQGLEEDLESTDASISGDIKIGKELYLPWRPKRKIDKKRKKTFF